MTITEKSVATHDQNPPFETNGVVIVGAGLAGLYTALKLAPHPVTVVAAAPLGRGASSVWAQGGIAAAVGEGDTPEAHALDTVASGAGLVNEALAIDVAREASDRVLDLLSLGVPFDKDLEGKLRVSKEAAHSVGRVVRVSGDGAGAAIMSAVIAKVHATPSIQLLEGFHAHDLITHDRQLRGLKLSDLDGNRYEMDATAVILATGGIGALYAISTNPTYARGEAIAMAARAGATISDAEFVQFHPTALDIQQNPAPLATEALRGEGATLTNENGERFLLALDPRGEMASRDIVALGVAQQIAAGHRVYLDCRTAIGAAFAEEFPTVYGHCKAAGIDPEHDLIPVAPAQHYHMGGIATDPQGRADIAGLWAIGETSATGLHGANRLASNSLLEALVFGARAAKDISKLLENGQLLHQTRKLRSSDGPKQTSTETVDTLDATSQIQTLMSQHVGVTRSAKGLSQAIVELGLIENRAKDTNLPTAENMALAARLIATSALQRAESRGAHIREDFPKLQPKFASRSMLSLQHADAIFANLKRVNPIAS